MHRIKKFLIPIVAAILVLSIGAVAFAASTDNGTANASANSVQSTQLNQNDKETNDAPETNDPNESTQLAGQASVTEAQAIAAAKAAYPDYTVGDKAELNDENGTIVYGIEATDANGQAVEIKVDANTGEATVSQEQEDKGENDAAETSDANEGSEQGDPSENAQLAGKASVTAEQAVAAAKAAYPDYQVGDTAELNDEDGTVVYGVQATDPSGQSVEIKVDANNIQSITAETGED